MATYDELIQSLTLEEKCALLSGGTQFGSRALPKHQISAISYSDGPHGLRKQAGAADHLGLNGSLPATCFPTAATVANAWDTGLGEEIGAALGEEAKAQGVNVLLGPGLNIKRNPLCGRNFEYFSEDPYLAGKLAAAYIRGIQSQGVSACPKHFAVNSQETRRMASDSVLDERTLREIYLTGFEIAVREGDPWTIMTSYNRVNGVYSNENPHLLQDILRGEWGFQGQVVTDWGGSNDHTAGVKAGSTVEMPTPGFGSVRELLAAVKRGELTEGEIDQRVKELLAVFEQTKDASGENPDFDRERHHALARRAAGESIVLLKNEHNILPLKPGTKVAVIGDFAESPRYQGSGSSMVNATKVENALENLKKSALEIVGFLPGYKRHGGDDPEKLEEAAELSKRGEVVLLFMGLDEIAESEGLDRRDMKLRRNQIEVLNTVAKENPNVVVVLVGGSPVETPWVGNCRALIHGYLGGQAGGAALVDALTGKINPSGKLAETWPVSYSDVPSGANYPAQTLTSEYREGLYIGYRYFDTAGIPVQFPFGFGLSYTNFHYEDLAASEKEISCTVCNTGSVPGAEIVQLYIGKTDSKIHRPAKELKGFAKVFLDPGESETVHIPLDDKTFRYFNVKTGRWEVENGTYQVSVGTSSADIQLTGTLQVSGTNAPVPCGKDALPNYFAGTVKFVSNGEFETLLGRKIPSGKVPIDENMTFGDLNHGRSPIFWLVWLVLTAIKNASEKKGKADLNILFIYNMPLRALGKMTGGMIDMNGVKGLTLEIRGFWGIGLVWFLVSCAVNLIRNAGMSRRLK